MWESQSTREEEKETANAVVRDRCRASKAREQQVTSREPGKEKPHSAMQSKQQAWACAAWAPVACCFGSNGPGLVTAGWLLLLGLDRA